MSSRDQIIVIRGEANWCKLVGAAKPYKGNPKFDKGPYWSIDLTPDAKSREILKRAGIADKLRQPKGDDKRRESYLTLTILETNERMDNGKNPPPSIADASGRKWGDDLIGNGSIVDLKVKVKDYGTTQGAYLQATRVLKHVPYEGGGFAPLDESDEWYTPATAAGDEPRSASPNSDRTASGSNRSAQEIADLDDDIPF